MKPTSNIVHSDPDILGGTPVFVGTRVPIKTFLDHFPSVNREQAITALELAKKMLIEYANST